MVETASNIWRDEVSPGVAHKPIKAQIREWGTDVETRVTAIEGGIGYSTRTALKAIVPVAGDTATLIESGREGLFIFRSGDYSALITADTLEGLYLKADTIAATVGAWVRQRNDLNVNIKWFGAVCDNATDDAAAINAAILALPVTGGKVFIPGPCRVGSPIVCGNGTSSVLSTRYGIHLVGTSLPNFTKDGSHPTANAAALRYTGAAGQSIISFKGPLIGWGVENLVIDAGGIANTTGLSVMSCSMGVTNNLYFKNCKISYSIGCYSGVTGYTPDISANSDVIRGGNIIIQMPNETSAIGMLFDGATDGTASTCFVNLDVVRIYPSTTHVNYGVILKVADAVSIKNLLISAPAAVLAGTYGVLFDYGGNAYFPCGCMLDVVDVGWNIPVAQQFINSGSSSGAAAPNHITNLSEVNGCRYPSQITNIITDQESARQRTYLATDFTGTDVATAQPVFGTTQDAVLLKATRNYRFKAVYNITRAAGAVSHTTGVLFGGTATFINVDGIAKVSNPTGNILSAVSQISFAVATETVITAANTSTTENVRVELEGIIRTNAAGTLIPQFKYSAAPGGAPTVKRGSFFEIWPIGEGGQSWTGDWS